MRHKCAGRQFGRNPGHRKALFRSLVTSFFEHERIETTEAKAKEMRTFTEQMITLGKRGDLHARRQALSFIRDKDVVARLFKEVAPRFSARNGGYTRLVKTRRRLGDGAEMAILELIDYKMVKKEKGSPTEPETENKPAGS
ncbi:MAG: 50S ribosomal protein L17 [Nitrospirae bacterium]|nr:50S ribosomal protein L17 [Nitrospirota bacterium]MBI3351737.1 50S ribosomal protein L17 [Nitrospirota bacterium]